MNGQTIEKTNIQKELDNNPYVKAIREDVLCYFKNRELAEPATIKDLVAVCQYFGEALGTTIKNLYEVADNLCNLYNKKG